MASEDDGDVVVEVKSHGTLKDLAKKGEDGLKDLALEGLKVVDPSKYQLKKKHFDLAEELQKYKAKFRYAAETVKRRCVMMVKHPWFGGLTLVLIFASTGVLAMESEDLEADKASGDEGALTLGSTIKGLNTAFAICFTIEMAIKIIALSFRGYLADAWNDLDAFIVVISWVTLFDVDGVSALRALRTLRALRPLRLVSRYPAMQLVVEALFTAMPAIANVIFVLLVFWLVFGILGCQLFGSQLRSCNLYVPPGLSPDREHLFLPLRALPNKTICTAMAAVFEQQGAIGGLNTSICQPKPLTTPHPNLPNLLGTEARCEVQWIDRTSGFNNLFEALRTLVEVATLQGWSEIMYLAMDIRGVDKAPLPGGDDSAVRTFSAAAFFVVRHSRRKAHVPSSGGVRRSLTAQAAGQHVARSGQEEATSRLAACRQSSNTRTRLATRPPHRMPRSSSFCRAVSS